MLRKLKKLKYNIVYSNRNELNIQIENIKFPYNFNMVNHPFGNFLFIIFIYINSNYFTIPFEGQFSFYFGYLSIKKYIYFFIEKWDDCKYLKTKINTKSLRKGKKLHYFILLFRDYIYFRRLHLQVSQM